MYPFTYRTFTCKICGCDVAVTLIEGSVLDKHAKHEVCGDCGFKVDFGVVGKLRDLE